MTKKLEKQNYEKDAFNTYQNFLYKRAMFGLSVYSQDELQKMNSDKKKRVHKVHARCQHVLNLWKQELCNSFTNKIFQTFFPERSEAKFFFLTHKDSIDPDFINTLSFKDMGIKKEHIVQKLIYEGILPRDFYKLKDDKGEKKVL